MKRYKNLLPLSIIFLLPIIFFWRIIFLKETLFVGDMITVNYPLRVFVGECLREGIIPLWCPYLYYGFPLLAEGQAGVFYPFNILLFTLFEPNLAYNYSIVLHFFLAGLFMFIYLRTIELDLASALLASITFMFSGVFITHLTYFNMLTIYVWLPLILYFIELLFRKKDIKYVIFSGIIFGIQFLGGCPQISIQILVILLIYFLFKVFTDKQRPYKSFIHLLIIFLIGFGIYAIQLFPMYELLKESYRNTPISYEIWTAASLSLSQVMTFILPDFWGNPFKGQYVGDWNYIDLCGYVGIIPLILGIIAVVLKRDKYSFLFLLICLLGLLLSIGKYNPLYNLLYHIPITSSLRFPSRYLYLYLWTFGMSILTGLGLNYLLKIDSQSIKRLLRIVIFISIGFGLVGIFSFSIIQLERIHLGHILYSIRIKDWLLFIIMSILSFSLIILYIKNRITPLIFASIFSVLLIVNIFICWFEFNPTVKKSLLTSMPESINFLKRDTDFYRINTYNWKNNYKNPIARSNISRLDPFKEIITSFKEGICPNISAMYKVSSIDGFLGLGLTRYIEFEQILNLKLLSLSNTKYVITSKDIHIPHPLVFSNKAINIFKNSSYLPRAFIVPQAKFIKNKVDVLKEIKKEDFNPKGYVILEEKPNKEIKGEMKDTEATVQITNYSPNKVIIKVNNLSAPNYLVLTDTYYPGWKVYVNNKREKIYRADYLFRAVQLKQGNSIVRFVYDPMSFNLGFIITVITLIMAGLCTCWNKIYNMKSSQEK